MTTNLETQKMSAIQKRRANSQYRNHFKDFTAQTVDKGQQTQISLPQNQSHNKLRSHT